MGPLLEDHIAMPCEAVKAFKSECTFALDPQFYSNNRTTYTGRALTVYVTPDCPKLQVAYHRPQCCSESCWIFDLRNGQRRRFFVRNHARGATEARP